MLLQSGLIANVKFHFYSLTVMLTVGMLVLLWVTHVQLSFQYYSLSQYPCVGTQTTGCKVKNAYTSLGISCHNATPNPIVDCSCIYALVLK